MAEAKRAWSARLLMAGAGPKDVATALARRVGAHTVSVTAKSARKHRNVVGVGEKLVDGKPTGVMAVKFYVNEEVPKAAVPSGAALPKHIDGLPTGNLAYAKDSALGWGTTLAAAGGIYRRMGRSLDRFDSDNDKRMLVRHYGRTEWKDAADFEVWIAANPTP